MQHIYGVPALEDSDPIGSIGQWSRALARALAARDAAIVRETGSIPVGSTGDLSGILTRLAAIEAMVDDLTPGPWTAIPLTSPAIAPGNDPTVTMPAFRVHGGYCYLRGRVGRSDGDIAAGTSWVMGSLPPEARPFHTVRQIIGGGPSSAWGRIEASPTTGNLTVAAISGSVAYLDLTGLIWPLTDTPQE